MNGEQAFQYISRRIKEIFKVVQITEELSHTVTSWERVIEQRLRLKLNIQENQLALILRRSTIQAIYTLR